MKNHEERFREFHKENPHVYAELVKLARQAKTRGLKKVGIRMLWEVMRWNRLMTTSDPNDQGWKLNDHYHSRYAREIVCNEPDLAFCFELRELKT